MKCLDDMKTINGISGGKTSSYIAANYAADYNIFALVTAYAPDTIPKDKSLVKKIENKINKEFIGTTENEKTLKVIFDLEQYIGKEIIWVVGVPFDNLINNRNYLPNKIARFCTENMKIKPTFEYWLKYIGEIVEFRIGYRYGEENRIKRFSENYRYRKSQNNFGKYQYNWEAIRWRIGRFPLIEDGVTHYHIKKFWQNKSLDFPKDSNCAGCFFKSKNQLRKNWDDSPAQMNWFAKQEKKIGATFKKEGSMNDFKKLPLNLQMQFGEGPGCDAGECTD